MPICLIEDDPIMGESLVERFTLDGIPTEWFRRAGDGQAALETRRFEAVLCDVRLPDRSGTEMFLELRKTRADLPPFLFITGYGELQDAVTVIKMGAADYIMKPFNVDQLIERVKHLALPQSTHADSAGHTLGISPAMVQIERLLHRLAASDTNVLITGETGVGKEVVARRLHKLGLERRPGEFAALNCAALPESLAESELFGHEKGAFTGATHRHIGMFERADGGTLFLDEIGDMPLSTQVKLLRALQDKAIERVGGIAPIPVDARVVCATHKDLQTMVSAGEFREDLFYRINVLKIEVPPLRERRDDILWLARYLLKGHAARLGTATRALHPEVERDLLEHPWPGNVRELSHCLERACVLSDSTMLTSADLFPEAHGTGIDAPMSADPTLQEYLLDCERRFIRQSLASHDYRVTQTAEHLGISRKTLWEKMKRLGIKSSGR